MTTPNDRDEWLESLLKQPAPYIDDAGFTSNVVSKLPPKKSPKRRMAIIGGSAVLAGLAAFVVPVRQMLPATVQDVIGWTGSQQALPIASLVLVALVAWAAVGLARAEDI